jgi:hypothetical protein
LPTIATITAAMKNSDQPSAWPNPSSEATSASETNAVATAATASTVIEVRRLHADWDGSALCSSRWRRRPTIAVTR